MAQPAPGLAIERWLSDPQKLRTWGISAVTLAAWTAWTYWSDAHWFYQVLFLCIVLTALVLFSRPAWYLNFLIILLIGDVTGYARDALQIPGLIGLAGVGGKAKIPELLSMLALLQLSFYFFLHPGEFRQRLTGRVTLFLLGGLVGTLVGLHHHYSRSTVLRDSLAYYFSIFYIMGLVVLNTVPMVAKTLKVYYYVTLGALLYHYVMVAVTGSTSYLYSATSSMFYSLCAYLLIAKLFSSPPRARRWLTALFILLFCGAMFIGRSRGSVLAFSIGLLPLLLALRVKDRLKILGGVVLPCLVLMLLLFAFESGRARWTSNEPTAPGQPGTRGIESFTRMGDPDHDPTGSYRLVLWKQAFQGFLESPLVGKGYGWSMSVLVAEGQGDYPAAIVHNSYIHILACSGLVGFIPLVAFIVGFFLVCAREQRRAGDSDTKRLFAAAAMSIGLNILLTATTNVGFETVNSGIIGWLMLAVAVRLATADATELERWVPRRYRAATR